MKEIQNLFDFIENSPSAYHTVDSIKRELEVYGYTRLYEDDAWELANGGKYYVIKNGTSIIAFEYRLAGAGFMICSSHSDSPSFRLKMSGEERGAYVKLGVERYGGMIYYSWLDRPLSLAGRVVVDTECGVETRLVNIERDLVTVPSVAIHLNRGVNDGYKFNPAVDMLPLFALGNSEKTVLSELAGAAGVSEEKIVAHDIFLYNRERGRVVGADGEFILAPRLDDLECVYSSMRAFLSAENKGSVKVLAVFDNEEVGSSTKQGAASTFLADTLSRIAGERYAAMLESSLMVSADNAHAKHPNHPELSDAANAPTLGGGIVIKYNADQRYATDGISAALFSKICKRANAKTQTYHNRGDMPGGSTLGSIADTRVSVPTVDIGFAELAMHSATETASASDLEEMTRALAEFYSTSLHRHGEAIEF